MVQRSKFGGNFETTRTSCEAVKMDSSDEDSSVEGNSSEDSLDYAVND